MILWCGGALLWWWPLQSSSHLFPLLLLLRHDNWLSGDCRCGRMPGASNAVNLPKTLKSHQKEASPSQNEVRSKCGS